MGHAIHCGPWGAGQKYKAINQAMCAINQVGVSMALLLAEKLGLDPKLVVKTLVPGAAGSWALENLGARAADDDFSGFPVELMRKDLLILEEEIALRLDIKLPGIEVAQQLLQDCMVNGEGREGTQAMLKAIRRMNKKR